ncbi:hypothetical protein BU198_35335 [Streptomyces sp. CBMA156]|nr:hypothetical protein [Streptomyces sp. CBMA156]
MFFHAELGQAAPDQWRHVVGGVGTDDGMVFDCRFAPLGEVGPTLVDGQDGFIGIIPTRVRPAVDGARGLLARLRTGTGDLPASAGTTLLERSGQVLRTLDRVRVTEIGAREQAESHTEPRAVSVDLSSGNPGPGLLPDMARLTAEAERTPLL